MKFISLKVVLLALFVGLGSTSCDELTGSWVRGRVYCDLRPYPSDYNGFFENRSYIQYYADTHILNNDGRPMRGYIEDVSLIKSTLEVSTPDYLAGNQYVIRGLIVSLGDHPSQEYVVDLLYISDNTITIYEHNSFDQFMDMFAYDLGRTGNAKIAVEGFVFDRYTGRQVKGATIDVVINNNLNVRLRN